MTLLRSFPRYLTNTSLVRIASSVEENLQTLRVFGSNRSKRRQRTFLKLNFSLSASESIHCHNDRFGSIFKIVELVGDMTGGIDDI